MHRQVIQGLGEREGLSTTRPHKLRTTRNKWLSNMVVMEHRNRSTALQNNALLSNRVQPGACCTIEMTVM